MPKPFDAASKFLFEADPASWLALIGLDPRTPVSVLDADLSTVTSDADKVLRIDAPEPWLIHVEVQAGHDSELARRLLRYNVLIDVKHGLPVHSVVVLLRPEANSPSLNGLYERSTPAGTGTRFTYQVVRLWQQPVGPILDAGIGTLPLAPVCDVRREDLPDVLTRLASRYRDELSPALAGDMWVATRTLMALRYSKAEIGESIRGALAMIMGIRGIEESWYYQEILAEGTARGIAAGMAEGKVVGKAEGRIEEVRTILARLGRIRFGEPTPAEASSIESLNNLARGEVMIDQLFTAGSWSELLAG